MDTLLLTSSGQELMQLILPLHQTSGQDKPTLATCATNPPVNRE